MDHLQRGLCCGLYDYEFGMEPSSTGKTTVQNGFAPLGYRSYLSALSTDDDSGLSP